MHLKKLFAAAAMLCVPLSLPAAAQSVADLYAQNCHAAEQQAGEGCKALAKSLPAVPAKAAPKAAADQALAPIPAGWGPLADVVGGIWHAPGQMISYSWIERGKVLLETELLSQNTRTFTLQPDGTIRMDVKTSALSNAYQPYSVRMTLNQNNEITGAAVVPYTFENDSETTFYVARRDDTLAFRERFYGSGAWIKTQRLTADELARASAFFKTAAEPAEIRRNWGLMAKMVGDSWEWKSFGDRTLVSYEWLQPGVTMLVTNGTVGNDAYFVAKPYRSVIGFDPVSRITGLATRGTEDGGMIRPDLGRGIKADYIWLDDGHYREISYQKKSDGTYKKLLTQNFRRQNGVDLASRFAAVMKDETDSGFSLGGAGFADIISGAIMGAATTYANTGGSSAGAIAGALGGAAMGSAGGNEALYQQMQETSARVTAEAEASQARLQRTIAQAERQRDAAEPAQAPAGASAKSAGERLVEQEQARAAQLASEREARAAEEQRLAEAEAARKKAQAEEQRRQAEAERNRPVEWAEGVVLCEPRAGSKEWRCTGPLQMNILALDAANTIPQLGLACGSANGIREIGPIGAYRAFGCGFGIHPTASDYPGNRDVPRDFGVFVSDRRVFHCPASKDAYCRTP